MMPSRRQSSWNAARASVSVAAQVLDAPAVAERAVLRPHPRVVEPGADRVRGEHLSPGVLHQVAQRAVEDARTSSRERRRVLAAVEPAACGLHADQAHVIVEERREHADGVASTANARHHHRRKPSQAGQHLRARLVADDVLQPAHQ